MEGVELLGDARLWRTVVDAGHVHASSVLGQGTTMRVTPPASARDDSGRLS